MQNPQPDTLQENTPHSIIHSRAPVHRQSVNTQPTHQTFLCLTGWCLMPGQSSPVTKISIFTDGNSCVSDPSHPPGVRGWHPRLVSPGSQTRKLSPPTLVDGSPPGFCSIGNEARRQAVEKVLLHISHIASHIASRFS